MLIPILAVSCVAYLLNLYYSKSRSYQSRQGLTGFEIARLLLDSAALPSVVVEQITDPLDTRAPNPPLRILLESSTFKSKSLYAAFETAKEVANLTGVKSGFYTPDLRNQFWKLWDILIFLGWCLIASGYVFGVFKTGTAIGQLILGWVFMMALLDLSSDWEVSAKAYSLLKTSGYFGAGELMHFKRFVRAYRMEKLASLFKVPIDFLMKFSALKRGLV